MKLVQLKLFDPYMPVLSTTFLTLRDVFNFRFPLRLPAHARLPHFVHFFCCARK